MKTGPPRDAVADVSRHCTLFHLRKASRSITQIYDATLAPVGLKGTQFTLLSGIALSEEATVQQLAERLVTDRTTLTRNLALLVKAGFVRIGVGTDRRSRLVTLTPKGREILAEALPLWAEAQAHVVSSLGTKRWRGLLDHLADVVSIPRR